MDATSVVVHQDGAASHAVALVWLAGQPRLTQSIIEALAGLGAIRAGQDLCGRVGAQLAARDEALRARTRTGPGSSRPRPRPATRASGRRLSGATRPRSRRCTSASNATSTPRGRPGAGQGRCWPRPKQRRAQLQPAQRAEESDWQRGEQMAQSRDRLREQARGRDSADEVLDYQRRYSYDYDLGHGRDQGVDQGYGMGR